MFIANARNRWLHLGLTLAALAVIGMILTGCGQPRILGGKYYPTYGVLNESSSRSKHVCYEVSFGNVIWSFILIETVVFPAYFIGFSLFNPVRMKKNADDDCVGYDP